MTYTKKEVFELCEMEVKSGVDIIYICRRMTRLWSALDLPRLVNEINPIIQIDSDCDDLLPEITSDINIRQFVNIYRTEVKETQETQSIFDYHMLQHPQRFHRDMSTILNYLNTI